MALSNIFREPRREITETVVGLVVLGVFPVADCIFAYSMEDQNHGFWAWIIAGLALLFALIVVLACITALALVIHAIGEVICNKLEARGVYLRPRRRGR